MSDELLPYYEKELAFIRQMGSEFSKEHPKVAGRLGISADTIEDPHVSRLVEGFAYLNARIQHKLDDDFPELTDALLNVVFPHYQRPIPSMSIAQFTPDEEQLDAKYTVNRKSLIETEHFQGEHCRFTLCYDVDLYPITVSVAQLMGRPFTTPGSANMRGADGVLKISLESFAPEITFPEINLENLRFYLRGQSQHVHPLYELLLNKCAGIVLSAPDQSSQPVYLTPDCIKPVGFKEEDGMLPYPPSSFIGYRLLTEYLIFPEKFMFVDFSDLHKHMPEDTEGKLDIYVYLKESDIELEHNISKETFALGCAPMINLFQQKSDPIRLDHTELEYQVIADARRPLGFEVYAVDKVMASTPAGDKKEYLPFYGLKHEHQNNEDHAYWFASRRNAKLGYQERDDGTDVFLSLVDLDFNPNIPEDRTLSLELTCSNRDQPSKLPYNLDHPKLQCVDSAPPCSKIRCLTQPTKTVRPPLRNNARWRLISHLNLNHLSLTGGESATEALKEILRLYDFKDSSVTKGLVESIMSVNARQISAPLNIDRHATMCRGVEVEIVLNETYLTGSSNYLYASILEHFFALYCSVNSFSRVLVKLNSKEGYLKKCPPRAGERVFL
ncbi:type VI secretion system baseplate subunit TssF [Agarilytica rhodophyticola]|uniref:type VI secretion system baseplate subunit TssF n=1 Tax=Agarilytica rhodophyticola TaxID=1737490 RepID=UPI000B3451A5|nr:type VI secretion system baseplate subunit TssF [Agarilytica rhodophyticola]